MMKNMTLEAIAQACNGIYCGDSSFAQQEIEGIVIDSRQVDPGFLYIPIVGERVDGHSFIPEVFDKGAACTLTEQPLPDITQPYIKVASTKQAIKDIAAYYRTVSKIKVIGVTGSVGKTSTKEMLAAVLGQKFNVLKTEGNFNNEIGLPLTVFRIRPEHEIAILEMGIDSFGEMHRLSEIAKPDICVITNIGYCHLENLGDRNGVLRAKTEIFDFLQPGGAVVLNGDDDKLKTIAKVKGVPPVFYGIENRNGAIWADRIQENGLEGISADLHIGESQISVHIPIPGRHMVSNAMAGMAVGQLMGMTPEEMAAGIESLQAVSGRNNRIETGVLTIIDDCYNANPVSMKASLDVLSQVPGRRVAILGDMFELGKEERLLHAQVGEYAAMRKIDVLLYVGELSKEAYEASARISGNSLIQHFNTKQELFAALPQYIQRGDTILVKASHGMEFTEVVEWLKQRQENSFLESGQKRQEARAAVKTVISNALENESARSEGTEPGKGRQNGQKQITMQAVSASENKRITASAIIFGVLALILNCILIVDTLMRQDISIKLSYYLVLLAVIIATILCGFYGETLFRVIRGILLLGLFEMLIVANQSELNSMLFGDMDITGISDWSYLLWFFFVAFWLVADGLKAVFLPESKFLLYVSSIWNVLQIVTGLSNIFLLYDYYKNQTIITAITNISMWRVYMMLVVYVIFGLLGLAHLVLSSKEMKRN